MILILSGEKGSGKTTLIRDILLEHGITVQGFLGVKEMKDGRVTGISLLILPEQRFIPMATTTPMATDMFTKRFYFYPGVFDRVNRHFRKITPECPFIFDEFGLLEMEGKGHYPVFSALLKSSHPTLIVVRRELAGDLATLLGDPSLYRTARMDAEVLATTRSRVIEFLQGDVTG